ncbi:MAG: response regulator [Candidatus Altiarchaeota archaeon]|nr:response regulator [Candidatus Altiarchaeota archaeon]
MPKILTIEDSTFERKAIRDMLARAGYTSVVEAESGEIGLERYKKEKPDLVLLDLRMPGMPGMEVLEELKKINPRVRVIIVSIVRKKETVDEALKLGVEAYVSKPITTEKLIPEVKKALGGN